MNRMLKLVSAFAAVAALSVVGSALAGNGGNRGDGQDRQSPLGRILVDARDHALRLPARQGHDQRLLRRLRRALAAAHHEGKPIAGPGVRASLLGTTKRKRRQARGHLRRPPALLLRQRPQARPDDRTGRRPVRRPVVGHLGRRKGDPPWLAQPRARPQIEGRPRTRGRRVAGAATTAEVARYLGAVSILVVGAIHAQQYYDAYFYVVPTIGTLFLLSFIGAGVVGVVLLAPVRRLGRRIGDLILALAALGGIGIAVGTFVSPLVSEYRPLFGFMESGYRLAIVLTLVFDVLSTAFLGAFVLVVGARLLRSITQT